MLRHLKKLQHILRLEFSLIYQTGWQTQQCSSLCRTVWHVFLDRPNPESPCYIVFHKLMDHEVGISTYSSFSAQGVVLFHCCLSHICFLSSLVEENHLWGSCHFSAAELFRLYNSVLSFTSVISLLVQYQPGVYVQGNRLC